MIAVRILLCMGAALVLYVCLLTVCALAVDSRRLYTHNSPFYRFLLVSACTFVLKLLRVRVQVSGLERLGEGERPLFVCNHCSNFDPIITLCVLRRWQPAFISKAENFRLPFFGRIIRRCCFMDIDRSSPKNAMGTITHASGLLQAGEMSVAVYPEGTRSKSGELLPFHNCVFKIAQKAEAPIVVLSLSGSETIVRNLKRLRASPVYLDVVDVIPADRVKALRTHAIGEEVREKIENSLQKRRESDEKQNICAF